MLGDRCFGDVDPALAEQACRFAAAARVELLAVVFSHAGADATFLAAHVWPDISSPELADALLARFGSGVQPVVAPESAAIEVCA